MNENDKLNEVYSICPNVYSDGYTTIYNFIELDKELFKSFMSGNIRINELLNTLNEKENHKKLIKSTIQNI